MSRYGFDFCSKGSSMLQPIEMFPPSCAPLLTRSDGIGSVGLMRGCVGRCSKRSSSVTCPLFLPERKRDPFFPFLRLLLRLIFSIPFLYNVQPSLENYCAERRQR